MSDEARPATSGGDEPPAKLELEPFVPPPAFAQETTVATVEPPAAAAPPDGPPKGKDVAHGFLDDDVFHQGSIGSGGGPAGSAFAGRVDGKDTLVAAGGGNGETEGAVRLALEWLARHQNLDGTWSAKSFGRRCQGRVCDGRGEDEYVSAT